MAQLWETIDCKETPRGIMELRRRGKRDFLILIDGRVLMNSAAARSEAALGELSCGPVAERSSPRVLIGGLGMAITLRAALDALPERARVLVAELEPTVEAWCRGPLAALTERAIEDTRVSVEIADVRAIIEGTALGDSVEPFDAIALDLFEGPAEPAREGDWLFGARGIDLARRALAPGGVFAVWSEKPGPAFEKRLERAGFDFECRRPGRGGLRHAVYVARARTSRSNLSSSSPDSNRS